MQTLMSFLPFRWKIILVAAVPLLYLSLAIGIFAFTQQRVLALNEQIEQKQLSAINAIKLDKATVHMYMNLLNYERFHLQSAINSFNDSLSEAIQLSDAFVEQDAKRAKGALLLGAAPPSRFTYVPKRRRGWTTEPARSDGSIAPPTF